MEWLDTFKKQREQFIVVQEGSKGIETFMHDDLMHLNLAYRDQVKHFLESCLAELKKKGVSDGKSTTSNK